MLVAHTYLTCPDAVAGPTQLADRSCLVPAKLDQRTSPSSDLDNSCMGLPAHVSNWQQQF